MKITTQESQAEPTRSLAAKTQDQRMVNEVVTGTGMSPWEAQVVVEVIREVYFATPGGAALRHATARCSIHIPTRGQQKDIGPTLTHKGVAIRHWLVSR